MVDMCVWWWRHGIEVSLASVNWGGLANFKFDRTFSTLGLGKLHLVCSKGKLRVKGSEEDTQG
eukprot:2100774-Amphidinium_carterae.1